MKEKAPLFLKAVVKLLNLSLSVQTFLIASSRIAGPASKLAQELDG